MGGTFNPVHMGHLLLAENAYSMFSLDEILFYSQRMLLYEGSQGILDGPTRLHMTALSISDNPHFSLSSMEIDRGGYTYTCQTLEQLEQENPDCDYYFIMVRTVFFKWRTGRILMSFFPKGCDSCCRERRADLRELEAKSRQLAERFQARIHQVPIGNIDISSSDIRQRVREGRSIRYLVHDRLREYIEENQLYRESACPGKQENRHE